MKLFRRIFRWLESWGPIPHFPEPPDDIKEALRRLAADHHEVFDSLRRAAKRFPQQRVGQLIDNALLIAKRPEDLYSVGDKELADALNAYSRLVDI